MANQRPCDPTETRPARNPPGQRPRGVFITGNDTGVGKTFVACQIAKALLERDIKVGVYKPIASGCRREGDALISDDAEALWRAAGKPKTLQEVCPQCFEAPLAPNLAAKAERGKVNSSLLRQGLQPWIAEFEISIVEGAGGYFSPLSDEDLCADLAVDFGFPVILVVANRLGAIHQSLATMHAIKTYRGGLAVAGIVLNDVSDELDASSASNLNELRRHVGEIPVAHTSFAKNECLVAVLEWINS